MLSQFIVELGRIFSMKLTGSKIVNVEFTFGTFRKYQYKNLVKAQLSKKFV